MGDNCAFISLIVARKNSCGVQNTNVKLAPSQVPLADLQCMQDEDTLTAGD